MLVDDIIKDKDIHISSDCKLVPIIAEESAGRNKIPFAMCIYLHEKYGCEIIKDIVQAVRANHTGATAIHRLKKVLFKNLSDDLSLVGNKYIIVDDHVTMGGTIASLASFIAEHGGILEEVISLSNNTHLPKINGFYDLSPDNSTIQKLKDKFGDYPERIIGMAYKDMTVPMCKELLKFKNVDTIKQRMNSITASDWMLSEQEMQELRKEFTEDYEKPKRETKVEQIARKIVGSWH